MGFLAVDGESEKEWEACCWGAWKEVAFVIDQERQGEDGHWEASPELLVEYVEAESRRLGCGAQNVREKHGVWDWQT